ncbi:MAG: hypothetical protein K2L79_00905, partial [Bacteroidales bacterium]|nr:hypothetical protein [Bacteroidales bacterium]
HRTGLRLVAGISTPAVKKIFRIFAKKHVLCNINNNQLKKNHEKTEFINDLGKACNPRIGIGGRRRIDIAVV